MRVPPRRPLTGEGWFQSSGSLLLCDVLNRSVELEEPKAVVDWHHHICDVLS